MKKRIAILFHRFGPYHWARLDACAERFEVLAVEESAESAEYSWDAASSQARLRHHTLLAAREKPTHPAREIARRLCRLLDERRPDAIAVPGWSDPAALAAIGWATQQGISIVLMSDSSASDERRQVWKESIKSRVVRLCGAGLVAGSSHAEYLTMLGMDPHRIFAGYDVVDNSHFAAVPSAADRARLRLPNLYFLASSRFVPKKNLFVLLSAFAAYRATCRADAWQLVLLGDGPLRDDLARVIAEKSLQDAVLLPGFQQYDELPAYYGLAGAFVHASTTEQWGLVVNEAMAAGLPVLISDRCGCARDLVVKGENGETFDATDPEALARLMSSIAGLPAPVRLAMGEVSRRIIARWTPSIFAESLSRAVEAADRSTPRRTGWADRALLRALILAAERSARRLLPVTA